MKQNVNMSMPIGQSIIGPKIPVFFDPHFPISINKPPVTVVTGGPGSGKTFFSMLLASQCSVSNKLNFILDYKGDFTSLKDVSREKIIGEVKVWSLLDPISNGVIAENIGILDPLLLSNEVEENISLTYDIVKILHDKPLSDEQANYLRPLISDVAAHSSLCSFEMLIQKLKENQSDSIRALGISLDTTLKKPIGQLLKKPKRNKPREFNFDRGTIVVSLMGLSLPNISKSVDNYTSDERISLAIMDLITRLITKTMGDSSLVRKTLIIDEAWALMTNQTTIEMIKSVALLGRSRNLATILITQSPNHLAALSTGGNEGGIENAISCRFAFKNDSATDNRRTIEEMNLPDSGWEEVLRNLSTGQCLMQDASGKTGIIQVIAPQRMAEAFDTNPTTQSNKK